MRWWLLLSALLVCSSASTQGDAARLKVDLSICVAVFNAISIIAEDNEDPGPVGPSAKTHSERLANMALDLDVQPLYLLGVTNAVSRLIGQKIIDSEDLVQILDGCERF